MPPFDVPRIGAGLPFADSVDDLARAVTGRRVAVVQAPPGTGKTTLVPPVVANVVALAGASRVVVTQPRRVAVRAAARRLAQLTGTRLGAEVGYAVRGERRTSRATVVEFVTPGILVRRLLADPDLPGVAAVVLDEVHERGLEGDLAVGMLAEVRELRDDLTVVAMSATLDAPRFAALLAGSGAAAPIVDCPSTLHPLQQRWVPFAGPRTDTRGVSRDFLDHVGRVAAHTHGTAARTLGLDDSPDTLVFVPGAGDVAHVAQVVRRTLDSGTNVEVLELHGRLDAATQDRVTTGRGPGEASRVVVSTPVAESSLTVPGVRVVVDAGLARAPRRDTTRAMSGLVTVAASRDSATQRAGRAARLGPGLVVRCYDEATYAAMPAHVTAEIATADLTGAALVLACWGAPRGEGLALPDAPPVAAITAAQTTLRGLGAVDAAGRVTPLGRRLAGIPADPRHARALLDGAAAVGAATAADVVAALSDDHRCDGADLPGLIRALRRGAAPAAARWRDERRRLVAELSREGAGAQRGAAGAPHDPDPPAPEAAGRGPRTRVTEPADAVGVVVALAHPERIARRVDDTTYLLASGTRAALPPGPLTGSEWLAVADVTRTEGRLAAGTGAVVRAAAPLGAQAALRVGADLLVDEVRATYAVQAGRVGARRVRALGAIELDATPVAPTREAARRAVAHALSAHGLDLFTFSPAADHLRRRLAFCHRHAGDPWPDVSDAALTANAEAWLGPELDALAAGAGAGRVDMLEALRRLLPWPHATRLHELVPERLTVPSGSAVRLDYPDIDDAPDAPPVAAVKLQECFGLAASPTVLHVPVVFHLLSPARRPLAVTGDLASFWSGPYQQVRAEMRGRYPKHPWPLDPWTAPATARTKPRC